MHMTSETASKEPTLPTTYTGPMLNYPPLDETLERIVRMARYHLPIDSKHQLICSATLAVSDSTYFYTNQSRREYHYIDATYIAFVIHEGAQQNYLQLTSQTRDDGQQIVRNNIIVSFPRAYESGIYAVVESAISAYHHSEGGGEAIMKEAIIHLRDGSGYLGQARHANIARILTAAGIPTISEEAHHD
jgi:hypothetical protein